MHATGAAAEIKEDTSPRAAPQIARTKTTCNSTTNEMRFEGKHRRQIGTMVATKSYSVSATMRGSYAH